MTTKKQHYVPRLMLRNFSVETRGEWRTQAYDLRRQQSRTNQNIRDVFSENYTYDTDNSFENYLEQQIETPAGIAIEALLHDPSKVSAVPDDAMLRFLAVQLARTRYAYEGTMAFIDKFMGTIFETAAHLNGLDPVLARKLRLEPTEPRKILTYITALAADRFKILSDLRVAIIINETPREFVMSDHPVFQHNWYLRDCDEPLSASLTVRGLQLFMPISTKITYCLYDNSIYSYHVERKSPIVRANLADVDILNSFQAINASSLMVAKSSDMIDEMKRLAARYGNQSAFSSHAQATQPREVADGKLRSVHYSWKKAIRLESLPAFIKVKNKVRRRLVICQHRRPDIVAAEELAEARPGSGIISVM
ncbi:DUF4238 domain-containing protein [Achromobacter xylosoxidans]